MNEVCSDGFSLNSGINDSVNTDDNIFPNKAKFILNFLNDTPVLEDKRAQSHQASCSVPPPRNPRWHCHKPAGEQPREHDFHSTDFVAESFLLTGSRCELTAERSGYGPRKGMELECAPASELCLSSKGLSCQTSLLSSLRTQRRTEQLKAASITLKVK